MTHISVNKLTTIGSDNGLSSGRHQIIISTDAGILLIGQRTNLSKILIEIHTFSLKTCTLNVVWEMAAVSQSVLNCKFMGF